MKKIFLIETTEEELADQIANRVLLTLKPYLTSNEIDENKTRKEAAKFLRISLPTLNEYTKRGYVRSFRVANRVLYTLSDLKKAMSEIPTLKRRG